MVRFGVPFAIINSSSSDLFQFQYGAIWSFCFVHFAFYSDDVSIPVWCDLEADVEGVKYSTKLFQFQYGAIWSSLLFSFMLSSSLVSIPVWCDLERLFRLHNVGLFISFNSSMVRFGV